jgi:hypothetical protein
VADSSGSIPLDMRFTTLVFTIYRGEEPPHFETVMAIAEKPAER